MPNLPYPENSQGTTFTGYTGGGPYLYTLHMFTVDQTGVYTATSTTSDTINTTWILNGQFSPNFAANPATPLGNFIVGVLSPGSRVGTFTGFNLTAGQTYTALVAYNITATSGVSNNTFVITGPGDIADCSGGVCPQPIPTTSEWTLILIGLLLAAGAAVVLQRRYRPII